MERRVPYHVLGIVRKDTATSSLERVLVVLWDSLETTVMRVSAYLFYSYLSLKQCNDNIDLTSKVVNAFNIILTYKKKMIFLQNVQITRTV